MPFAPVTLKERADECYKSYDPSTCPAADFMTITFECTEKMQDRAPGAVHLDGTARPQLITEKYNPIYHQILSKYEKKTGIPTLINTSFNKHGEPIVCKPAEALKSFTDTDIDALVLSSFFIKNDA
jgi:carbamoyltransferase